MKVITELTPYLSRFHPFDTLINTTSMRSIDATYYESMKGLSDFLGFPQALHMNLLMDQGGHHYWNNDPDQKTRMFFGISLDLWHSNSLTPNAQVRVVDFKARYRKYSTQDSFHYRTRQHHTEFRIFMLLEKHGVQIPTQIPFWVGSELFGLKINEEGKFEVGGKTYEFPDLLQIIRDTTGGWGHDGVKSCEFTRESLGHFAESIGTRGRFAEDLQYEDCMNAFRAAIKQGIKINELHPKGVSKVYAKVAPIADSIQTSDIETFLCFRSLAKHSGSTINKVRVSGIFNEELKDVTTAKELRKKLAPLRGAGKRFNWFDGAIEAFPCYKIKRKAAIKATSGRAFSRLMKDYEFLSLDEKKFPKTTKAVKEGDLPLGIFFRKSEQYFLLNDNFELWEGMLKNHYDITLELAKTAAKRTTYEKDLMSYFYFVLTGLPEYMKKHTKKKWKCIPRLVDSPSELNPPADDGSGIVRTRSALTPVADNENCTIVVPYASLAMPGRQTTYCYSHNFEVIHSGLNINGNTVTHEIEEKLNGRDDYGLMFYTLTGSAQGRGYPTFLIIFENRTNGVFVHFHRTHPSRSKDGDYNGIHNWIKVCYNWMAGNVHKSRIVAQQGDLVFVDDSGNDRNFAQNVDHYDNHMFESPVEFAPYALKKKDNILGYIRVGDKIPCAATGTILKHHEHEWIGIPKGQYEIRQCRSWEANPQGVWSLRID